jgi:chromosome segregation ATPase
LILTSPARGETIRVDYVERTMDSSQLKERRAALSEERDQLGDRRAELAGQLAEGQRQWRAARIDALIAGQPEPEIPDTVTAADEAILEIDRRTADLTTAIKKIDAELKSLVHEERRAATAALEYRIQPKLEGLAVAAREALARYSAARLLCAGLDLDKADAGRAAELVRGDRGEWYAAVKTAAEELK